ncbi:hypothetical protein EW146_g2162 [Bondarzewia mesenterica]|uniref:HIG1 domain-containing protein n=1 Tax=Bondarzewia mesenterica TaxID=1095465 RepID=A0A4S4M7Q8_9AGAM|nr:hypothetical protein EW146_g2162 [Bondarzewia mesenterica]
MDELPIDTSNPAVRDYLSLIRLQVLTPLSLLINIVTVLICSLVVTPSIGQVIKRYPTSISPSPPVIAAFILAIYIGQIGYCLLLVLVSKPETKQTLVKGVGPALVLSNWIMAAWAISWIFRSFLVSTILLGILLLLLLYSNVVIIVYHPPTRARPLDVAFIHAPLRLFLILPLSLLFPYSLFITLGHAWDPAHPDRYTEHQWEGFGVVLGTNILGLLLVTIRRDIVWCVGATWICVSVWASKHKPPSVYITEIMFTVLHPLGLVASVLWVTFAKRQREGRIRLPPDEDTSGSRTQAPENGHEHQERADSVEASRDRLASIPYSYLLQVRNNIDPPTQLKTKRFAFQPFSKIYFQAFANFPSFLPHPRTPAHPLANLRIPFVVVNMSTEHIYSTETYRDKAVRKFKQQPIVPIGAAATTVALIVAMTKMRKGQSSSMNNWLRVRIVTQGLTIGAIVAGSWVYGSQHGSPAQQEQAAVGAVEKAREERAEFEERLRGAEEAHRFESRLNAGLSAREKATGEPVVESKSGDGTAGVADEVVKARARAQAQVKAQQNSQKAQSGGEDLASKKDSGLSSWFSLSSWTGSGKSSGEKSS